MIVVIDYGMGNVGSILNMLKKIGAKAIISSKNEDIKMANKLILPGVGAFDNAMENLNALQLIDLLNHRVLIDKIPILGICLGIQLLTKESEEGKLKGLGWIDAKTIRFDFGINEANLKIPHMGWNTAYPQKKNLLFKDMFEESRFYFVHSYHVVCNDKSDILTITHHGFDFISGIAKDNIMGVQFHPEKSHKFGMRLLGNFAEL